MTKEEYEIDYWKSVRNVNFFPRYKKLLDVWEIDPQQSCKVLEIGAGPRSGVLPLLNGYKVSLDPLNGRYEKEDLLIKYHDITYISEGIKETTLNEQFDLILCRNALDHGNSDFSSIDVIKRLLCKGGKFYLAVHLRDKSQLNEGHDHYMDIQEYRKHIEGFNEIYTKIYSHDPVENDAYVTLVSLLEKK